MIFIYSSAHEPAPLLEQPIIEYNAEKRIRPIFKKIRKVRGKTGWLLRRYGHWFGAPKNDPEGLGHHALQIGEYVYELTREEGLVGQRLTGHQIWESTIKHAIIGWTDLSDVEIQDECEFTYCTPYPCKPLLIQYQLSWHKLMCEVALEANTTSSTTTVSTSSKTFWTGS